MKFWRSWISGLVGALALTALHETARRVSPEAPRMDLLGMRAISKSMEKLDVQPPSRKKLFWITMVGDVLANSLYYSLVGLGREGKQVWLRGSLLGTLAGIGGVALPSPLGLGSGPSGRTWATRLMTVAWYATGGAVAAGVYRLLEKYTDL